MFQTDLEKTCCDVHFALVMMDINMPVMNGFDSTKGIIAFQKKYYGGASEFDKERRPRAPVMAMTAFGNKKTIN